MVITVVVVVFAVLVTAIFRAAVLVLLLFLLVLIFHNNSFFKIKMERRSSGNSKFIAVPLRRASATQRNLAPLYKAGTFSKPDLLRAYTHTRCKSKESGFRFYTKSRSARHCANTKR